MPHRCHSALALCYGLISLLISVAPAAELTPARVAVTSRLMEGLQPR
jgi:hypothetical protein